MKKIIKPSELAASDHAKPFLKRRRAYPKFDGSTFPVSGGNIKFKPVKIAIAHKINRVDGKAKKANKAANNGFILTIHSSIL
jgi:hypothetical protein